MDANVFKSAPVKAEYTLSPFWFWNDTLDDDRLREQLQKMRDKGIFQAVIHARTYMDPGCVDYLSEDWFAHVSAAVDEAKEHGMNVYIYDENNWPSGTIDCTLTKNEEFREHFLMYEKTALSTGDDFVLKDDGRGYLCVAAMEEGEPLRILAEGGEFRYMAACDCEVVAIWVAVDPYEGDGMRSIDYLSQNAIGAFVSGTHEKYEAHMPDALGSTVKGMFMDETRFCNAYPWTNGLEKLFQKKKGYDIISLLPLLFCDGLRSKFVRYDYFDFVSDLCGENTFERVYDWCERNHVEALAHFLGEETLSAQAYFGCDMMRYYKYLHKPGLDHLGRGIGGLAIKNGVSAAANYGKKSVFCEAFGGAGNEATIEDITRMGNWLFQQGVDQIMIHGFAYSMRPPRDEDWPPSYFETWHDFDKMKPFAEKCARMSSVVKGRVPENEILMYHPIESFVTHFIPDITVKTGFFREGPAILDARAAEIDCGYQLLCNSLLDQNLDFTVWNADSAPNFKVVGKSIVNTLTGAEYTIVILPYVELLPKAVYAVLAEFEKAGGTIIKYNCDFDCIVGKRQPKGGEETPIELPSAKELETITAVAEFCLANTPELIRIEGVSEPLSRNVMQYPPVIIDPFIHDGEDITGVAYSRFSDGDSRIFDITNYSKSDETLTLRVRSSTRPMVLDPDTGEDVPISVEITEGWRKFELKIAANRKLYIVCGK